VGVFEKSPALSCWGAFLLVIPRCPERSERHRGISWGDPSLRSGWQERDSGWQKGWLGV